MAAWVPDSGDIVWVNFDPQAGHERAGHRPALVLSPARYNGLRGMMRWYSARWPGHMSGIGLRGFSVDWIA